MQTIIVICVKINYICIKLNNKKMIAKVILKDGKSLEVAYDTMIAISNLSVALYLDNRMVANIPSNATIVQDDMSNQIIE